DDAWPVDSVLAEIAPAAGITDSSWSLPNIHRRPRSRGARREIEDRFVETHRRQGIHINIACEVVHVFAARRLRYLAFTTRHEEVTEPMLRHAKDRCVESPDPGAIA